MDEQEKTPKQTEEPKVEMPVAPTQIKAADGNYKKWLTILIIIAVLCFSLSGYLLFSKQNEPATTSFPAISETPTPSPNPTIKWETYTHPDGFYQFSYPKNWKLNLPCSQWPTPTPACDGEQNYSDLGNPEFQALVPNSINLYSFQLQYFPADHECKDWADFFKVSTWKKDNLSLNGTEALTTRLPKKYENFSYTSKDFFVAGTKHCYSIEANFTTVQQEKTLDAVLSTFKITE